MVMSDDESDDETLFDIGRVSKRMINSVRVREAPPIRVAPVQAQVQEEEEERRREQDVPGAKTFQSKKRHTDASPEDLSERWNISWKTARETLKRTTQKFVRSAAMPLARRHRADRIFQRKRLDGVWATDTMDGRVKSLDGNRHAQVFSNKDYFSVVYPMDSKSKAGDALRMFCAEHGVPESLHFDGSKEQTCKGTEFVSQIRKNDIDYHVIEPERHNQNPAEGVIREIRRKWFRTMIRKRVPRVFWDYGAKWVAEIMRLTHTTAGGMNGCIPTEKVTGETPDISEHLDFGFYDRVWHFDNAGLGPEMPGRWLGMSHCIGSLMSYYVLTQTGSVISRTTVQHVTNLEMQTEEKRKSFEDFDAEIKRRIKEDDLPEEGANGPSSMSTTRTSGSSLTVSSIAKMCPRQTTCLLQRSMMTLMLTWRLRCQGMVTVLNSLVSRNG